MNLIQQFPDISRQHRVLKLKSLWWKIKKAVKAIGHYLMIILGFGIACVLILVLMGLLKALGVKEL